MHYNLFVVIVYIYSKIREGIAVEPTCSLLRGLFSGVGDESVKAECQARLVVEDEASDLPGCMGRLVCRADSTSR